MKKLKFDCEKMEDNDDDEIIDLKADDLEEMMKDIDIIDE